MKIRTRLVLSLTFITALLTVPLVIALVSLGQQSAEMTRLRDRELGASLRLGRVRAAFEELRSVERRLTSNSDTAAWSAMAAAGKRLSAITGLLSPYELSTSAGNVAQAINEISSDADSGYRAAASGYAAGAAAARSRLTPGISRAVRALNATERGIHQRAEQAVVRAAQRTSRALSLAGIMFVVALAAAAVPAFTLTRAISRPVEDLKEGMQAVSEGRMDHRLSTNALRADEFGYLAAGFTGMVQRLTQLEGLRQKWLGHYAHELKNPLGVMRGTLDLFGEGIHVQLTPQGQDFCDRAIRTSKVLEARILNMIQVAKLQTGHGDMEATPFSLDAFLRDVDAAFQILAARASVEFRFHRVDPLPEQVTWDEDGIRQVLENLVSNALKFTPADGRVEVRVRSSDGAVSFEVSDTGAGIPAEALPKLFDLYYQADNQRKASAKGTGLGLAIAKGIADAHGGQIRVESELDRGTTFVMTLPVKAPAASASAAASASVVSS